MPISNRQISIVTFSLSDTQGYDCITLNYIFMQFTQAKSGIRQSVNFTFLEYNCNSIRNIFNLLLHFRYHIRRVRT